MFSLIDISHCHYLRCSIRPDGSQGKAEHVLCPYTLYSTGHTLLLRLNSPAVLIKAYNHKMLAYTWETRKVAHGKVETRHLEELGWMGRAMPSQGTAKVIQASPAKRGDLRELHWINGRFNKPRILLKGKY